jgi:hypothetical protein
MPRWNNPFTLVVTGHNLEIWISKLEGIGLCLQDTTFRIKSRLTKHFSDKVLLSSSHTMSATLLPGSTSICRVLPFLGATTSTEGCEGSVTSSILIKLNFIDHVRFMLKTNTSAIHPTMVIPWIWPQAIEYPTIIPDKWPTKLACGTMIDVNISDSNGAKLIGSENTKNV